MESVSGWISILSTRTGVFSFSLNFATASCDELLSKRLCAASSEQLERNRAPRIRNRPCRQGREYSGRSVAALGNFGFMVTNVLRLKHQADWNCAILS